MHTSKMLKRVIGLLTVRMLAEQMNAVRPNPFPYVSEKCNNHTLPDTTQNILKRRDMPADGVGRAGEGSQTNLQPKNGELHLIPKVTLNMLSAEP